MIEIVLIVPGSPVGKQRVKFNRSTGRAYTPEKTLNAEQRVFIAWDMAGKPRLEDGPLYMGLTAVMARPQDHWRRDGSLTPKGERTPYPLRAPDFDNLAKLVADALGGHAYRNDALIAHGWQLKRWANPGEGEHIRIQVAPMAVPSYMREAA